LRSIESAPGQPKLIKDNAEHAIMIYCLRAVLELSQLLQVDPPRFDIGGKPDQPLESIIESLVTAHRLHYFNAQRGVFVSGGNERQISWAGNAWAVLAGVPETVEQSQEALRVAYEDPESIVGMTPYLHHYVSLAAVGSGSEADD
jgi:alpha-L-rhamnosidase